MGDKMANSSSFRPPMLCQEVKSTELDNFTNGGWIAQDKIDGVRAVLYVQTDGSVVVQGRRKFITHRYPELQRAFPIGCDYVLDAEVCTKDEIFNHLQYREQNNNPFKVSLLSGLHPCKVMVFDILELNGVPLVNKPLFERLKILKDTVIPNDTVFVLDVFKGSEIKERFERATKMNKEGIVIKQEGSNYIYGKRSPHWLKCKTWFEATVNVSSYEVNPAGITCSNVSGFRVQVAGKNSEPVRSAIDANGSVDIEIQYLELTKNGCYRMPTFKRLAGSEA